MAFDRCEFDDAFALLVRRVKRSPHALREHRIQRLESGTRFEKHRTPLEQQREPQIVERTVEIVADEIAERLQNRRAEPRAAAADAAERDRRVGTPGHAPGARRVATNVVRNPSR